MKYCKECGQKLSMQFLEHEGMTPFCTSCQEYRFPVSNTAVSMVVLHPDRDQILLIQQYGRKQNILVAGYVNQKETLEDALVREYQEEIGGKLVAYQYLKSEYFEKSNTLICNFVGIPETADLSNVSDWEVDEAAWFSLEDAKHQVKQASLAQRFYLNFLYQLEKGMIII